MFFDDAHADGGTSLVSDQTGDLSELGDFTATPRIIGISLVAIGIGVVSASWRKGCSR